MDPAISGPSKDSTSFYNIDVVNSFSELSDDDNLECPSANRKKILLIKGLLLKLMIQHIQIKNNLLKKKQIHNCASK